MERAVVAELRWPILKVLGEAFLFRDGVEFFGPGFKVTDTTCELDSDLTWFGHRGIERKCLQGWVRPWVLSYRRLGGSWAYIIID